LDQLCPHIITLECPHIITLECPHILLQYWGIKEAEMAKQMVQAVRGALDAELKKRKKTQKEFAEELSMDRKTLRAIDRGRPVKDTTLNKIAVKLRVPIDHLLEGSSDKNLRTNDASANSILLRPVRAPEIKALLSEAALVQWKLLIDTLEERYVGESTHELILEFERVVN
jgi:transcriptional regulator with XRE-family HTH domain